jgi:hypothetical protein
MKILLFGLLGLVAFSSRAQLLYDPTTVYDADGSGAMFDLEEVHDIHLTFYETNYHSILVNRWFDEDETRLPAQLDMGDIHFDSVGVKYKGNSTFYIANLTFNPKVPYNIDMNEYIGGQKLLGYKKLKLANALFDPTFAKEALASHIYGQYLPTHQANIVRLTVNGNYVGAYVNTESIGKQFLKKHFDEKNGTFVKCEPSAQFGTGETFYPADLVYEGTDTLNYYESYEIKSDSVEQSWEEFIELMDVLNNDPLNLEEVLNIDRVLWYFAVTTVLPNDDAYNTMVMHNYYMYKTGDGKFQMLPWDLSETFCGAMIGQLTKADHYERDPFYGYTPLLTDHPLVYRILADPYYRMRLIHHVRVVMNEFYDQSQLKSWAQDLQASAYSAVDEDSNKPFNMDDYEDNLDNNMFWFTTEIAGITETIDNRRPYLESHPEVLKTPPTISSVDQNIDNPTSTDVVYITAEVSGADNVYLRITNDPAPYASNFPSIEMLDDGSDGDVAAGDGIYTAQVPYNTSDDHIKYYIEATNDEAMALMPERAEYFYYHFYIDQVVGNPEITDIDVQVYPNPAVDQINVNLSKTVSSISLYTLNGERVYNFTKPALQHQINCNHLQAGTYLLLIEDDSEVIGSKKLIIR